MRERWSSWTAAGLAHASYTVTRWPPSADRTPAEPARPDPGPGGQRLAVGPPHRRPHRVQRGRTGRRAARPVAGQPRGASTVRPAGSASACAASTVSRHPPSTPPPRPEVVRGEHSDLARRHHAVAEPSGRARRPGRRGRSVANTRATCAPLRLFRPEPTRVVLARRGVGRPSAGVPVPGQRRTDDGDDVEPGPVERVPAAGGGRRRAGGPGGRAAAPSRPASRPAQPTLYVTDVGPAGAERAEQQHAWACHLTVLPDTDHGRPDARWPMPRWSLVSRLSEPRPTCSPPAPGSGPADATRLTQLHDDMFALVAPVRRATCGSPPRRSRRRSSAVPSPTNPP